MAQQDNQRPATFDPATALVPGGPDFGTPPEATTLYRARVAVLGRKESVINFEAGTTVGLVLSELGIVVGKNQTVTMNGQPVNNDAEVTPDSVIGITSNIANG